MTRPAPPAVARLSPVAAPVPLRRLAVAVSGGGDSVALLHGLLAAGWSSDRIVVLHVDHARRAASAAEARFVREMAAGLGCEFRFAQLDPEVSGAPGVLRALRLGALRRMAGDCDAVALAHHADDQRESRWWALLRGSGLRGLAGMRPWQAPWWRPWLDVSRQEIRVWATACGLTWVDDPSNVDFRHPRARLRHLMLPSLARPLTRGESLRVRVLQDEDDWLADRTAEWAAQCIDGAVLDRGAWREGHPVLQRRALRVWLGAAPSIERIEAARAVLAGASASGPRVVEIDGNTRLIVGSRDAVRWLGPWPVSGGRWGGLGRIEGAGEAVPWMLSDPSLRKALRKHAGPGRVNGALRAVWPLLRLADGRVGAPVSLASAGPFFDAAGKALETCWQPLSVDAARHGA